MERLLLILALWLSLAGASFGQTVREDHRSGEPVVFDTIEPSSYRFDFPLLPPEAPFGALPRGEPFSLPALSDPQSLLFSIEQTALPHPSRTPGDYDPEEVFLIGNIANEEPPQAGISEPPATPREIVLLDRGHPIFYAMSDTAALFQMEESLNSQIAPDIPEPALYLERPRSHLRQVRGVRFALDLFQSVAWTDNLFGAGRDRRSDLFFTVNPRIYLETGTRGLATFSYAPSLTFYQRYREMNATNENLSFSLRYPFTKLVLLAEGSHQSQTALFINSDGVARAHTTLAKVGAAYPFTAKTSGEISYLAAWTKREPGGERDDHRIDAALLYAYSPKLTFGPYLEVGQAQAPVSEQDYATAGLRLLYRPDFHLRFEGRVGYHTRSLDPVLPTLDRMQTPVWTLIGAYHYTSNLTFILRSFREVGADAFESVALQTRTGGDFTFLMRLYSKTDLNIRVGGGYIDQWSDQNPFHSDLGYLQGSLTLSHAFTRHSEAVLFHHYQRRFASSHSHLYTSNTVGFALRLRF